MQNKALRGNMKLEGMGYGSRRGRFPRDIFKGKGVAGSVTGIW